MRNFQEAVGSVDQVEWNLSMVNSIREEVWSRVRKMEIKKRVGRKRVIEKPKMR